METQDGLMVHLSPLAVELLDEIARLYGGDQSKALVHALILGSLEAGERERGAAVTLMVRRGGRSAEVHIPAEV